MAALFDFKSPTNRLWNFIRPTGSSEDVSIGLALSSGGAKGLAHIGVIQVLEENDIPISAVAGTSMGAYVGGLWAAGHSGEELEALAATMMRRRDLLSLIDPVIPRRGFISGGSIEARLRESLGDLTFEECERPLSIVATQLESYARDILEDGDVVSAIMASLAIPGIITPYERDGIEYIDGGVAEPLPVSPLMKRGVDKIVAVSVLPTISELLECRTLRMPKPSLWQWFNSRVNLMAHGNLLDIMRTSAMGSQMRLVERDAKYADVLIRPVTCDARWHDYTNFAEYIRIGRETAHEALPMIQALLSPNPNPDHDNELAVR